MIRKSLYVLAGVVLFAASTTVHASDYYVSSGSGSDSNSGTSSALPFKTFDRMTSSLKPGDTGHVLSGSYSCLYIAVSGQAGKIITIKGEGSTKPRVWASSSHCGYNAIYIAPSTAYVTLQGFDVTSGSGGNGIFAGDYAHHLTIMSNVVHDAQGGGINSNKGDYLQIHDNVVYHNAVVAANQCSGISLYQLTNFDTASGYHNRIYNNIVYGNYNGTPVTGTNYTTDGNGIIIDDSRHTQHGYSATKPAYTGSTQVFNNVVFNNGGRGIHAFLSDNVMIANNTVYLNNWDLASNNSKPAEISSVYSGNVQIYNNVTQAEIPAGDTRTHYGVSMSDSSGGAIVGDYNLTYGGTGAAWVQSGASTTQTWGSNNLVGDPQFIAPSIDPASANFRVASTSPAQGLASSLYAPSTDILGTSRSGTITAGAYQIVPVTPTPTVTLSGPGSAIANQSFALTWSSTNATSCTASGGKSGDGWSGTIATSGSLSVHETTGGSYSYGISCTGSGGSKQASMSVAVSAVPTATLNAPSSATTGQAFTLSWSSSAATSCTASGGNSGDGWGGSLAASGSKSITETTSGTQVTYSLSCTGAGGSAQASKTVTVNAVVLQPAVMLSAPSSATAGQAFTLSWTSTNATACTQSGGTAGDGWAGAVASSGSASIVETTGGAQVTYTISCAGSGGSAQIAKAVTIQAVSGTPGGSTGGSGVTNGVSGSGGSGSSGGGSMSPLVLLALAGLKKLQARRR